MYHVCRLCVCWRYLAGSIMLNTVRQLSTGALSTTHARDEWLEEAGQIGDRQIKIGPPGSLGWCKLTCYSSLCNSRGFSNVVSVCVRSSACYHRNVLLNNWGSGSVDKSVDISNGRFGMARPSRWRENERLNLFIPIKRCSCWLYNIRQLLIELNQVGMMFSRILA